MEGLGPQLMDINCKLLTQQRVHAEGTAKQLPSKASYAPQAPSSSSRGLGKQVGLLTLGALFAVFGIFSQYFPVLAYAYAPPRIGQDITEANRPQPEKVLGMFKQGGRLRSSQPSSSRQGVTEGPTIGEDACLFTC